MNQSRRTEITYLPVSKRDRIMANAIHAALMNDLRIHGELKTAPHVTRDNHIALGIVVCDGCGKLCSVDYKWCSECREEVMVCTEIVKKQVRK